MGINVLDRDRFGSHRGRHPGVKGVAFSLDSYDKNADFGSAARLARELLEQVKGWSAWTQRGLPQHQSAGPAPGPNPGG